MPILDPSIPSQNILTEIKLFMFFPSLEIDIKTDNYCRSSPQRWNIHISTDLIARYGRGVQAEAAPGPQPVVDRHDDDVRLYEEVRPVEDALACGESPSVEPDQD